MAQEERAENDLMQEEIEAQELKEALERLETTLQQTEHRSILAQPQRMQLPDYVAEMQALRDRVSDATNIARTPVQIVVSGTPVSMGLPK